MYDARCEMYDVKIQCLLRFEIDLNENEKISKYFLYSSSLSLGEGLGGEVK